MCSRAGPDRGGFPLHHRDVESVHATSPAPFDGEGLNPILQDPALAIHPPFLYAGYVGFSMAFSSPSPRSLTGASMRPGRMVAVDARRLDVPHARHRLGLVVGLLRARLGRVRFWDPVENASFMPWLAGTALLHSALVMEKRDALKVWTILPAIITFSLSLMGTFPRALGRAHLRARLCRRSRPRRVHSRHHGSS